MVDFCKRFAQQPHDRLKVEELVLLAIARGVGKDGEGIVAVAVEHDASGAI